ncbi:hypothetical protein AWC14_15080 [Mycobacterium kyorinense]|uniref:Uncharacterized protein n=2 Tax=Mycobacterium kyorinense TaxID=487514 RepID=A0A1X1XF29_9MYCO|nr:hypothetical protein AWC14_15080 [Mycobacterium kyorinense]
MFMLPGVISMVLFAAFLPLGEVDFPVPREQRYAIPAGAGVAAMVGILILWRGFERGGMSYLCLSPAGFNFAEGLFSAEGQWDQVTDVTDRMPRGRTPNKGAIVMVMSDGRTPTFFSGGSYLHNEQALRELVRFYWQHPEHRDELTDGRALARLSSNGFEA